MYIAQICQIQDGEIKECTLSSILVSSFGGGLTYYAQDWAN